MENIKNLMTVPGQICPESHPIPCSGGGMCTAMARASNEDFCSADDVVSGACCPEDTVPCKYTKPQHRCREHPKHGLVDRLLAELISSQLTMIDCRIPVPIKSSHSVSRRIHVHKHEQPDPLQ